MASLLHDFRLAIRGLRRSPLFAAVAILSLALGIGANAAMFRLIDQLLLRKLPVRAPDELVMLYQQGAHMGSNMGSRMHSYPLYQDLQQKAAPFSEVICRRVFLASVATGGQTDRVQGELVSGNYFTMLGVKPALGRVFSSREDDQVYKGHPVVVLGYDYWVSRFAGDPGVIGRTIRVNDYPMTIVGVSARGFAGLDPSRSPQLRVPVLMEPMMMVENTWLHMEDRRSRWVQVFARLKPGWTMESAQARVQALFTQVRAYEMTLPEAKDWSAYDRDRFMKGRLLVAGAAIGYSPLRNDFSTSLLVLMCMVGLVLLIACANVANLLIARGFMRQKEIAIRLSLGSSRGRLVRQLVVESVVLSLAGGALGISFAYGITGGLLSLIPSNGQPLLLSPQPDLRVLAFTLVLACATGVLFGLLPALRASRPDPWTTLKDTTGSIAGTGGSLFLRKGLVVAQVTLSFVLLAGAGLFVRSLQNLRGTDAGVAVENLVSFELAPASSGYDDQRASLLYNQLLERLRSAPGVTAATYASVGILAGDEWDSSMTVEGHQAKDGEDVQMWMNTVSPGYFQTMRVPLLEGRDFRPLDAVPFEKLQVAIVNRRFAQQYFPGRSAIGKRIGFGDGPRAKLTMEIVGVVENALYEGPREGIHRQVYLPNYGNNGTVFYLRTRTPIGSVYALARREVRRLDAGIPVYNMKTLEAQLDETLLTDRLIAILSAGFGLLATLLASIGLYGVMAFLVARRTKELGIRLALGAQPGRVIWMVMREVVALLAIGLAIGVPAALALGRFVASQLFGIKPGDPAIAAMTVAVLTCVSIAAGLLPARRASRIDPILALRAE
jgi:predicted permease